MTFVNVRIRAIMENAVIAAGAQREINACIATTFIDEWLSACKSIAYRTLHKDEFRREMLRDNRHLSDHDVDALRVLLATDNIKTFLDEQLNLIQDSFDFEVEIYEIESPGMFSGRNEYILRPAQ